MTAMARQDNALPADLLEALEASAAEYAAAEEVATEPIERITYSIRQAAAAIGTDRVRFGALVRMGAVPHVRFGEHVVIGKLALERWLTEQCLANVTHTAEDMPIVRRIRRKRGSTAA